MDSANLALAEGLVSATYIRQGGQALTQRHGMVKALLSHRHLPQNGWDDATIELLLRDMALMDSNNFPGAVGMGEREARCVSNLVWQRHYGFAHGIGRSGNITDEQPKAAGSTLAARLTNLMVKDALLLAGLQDIGAVSVLPVATGMALSLSLQALKRQRPTSARYVLWPRIDQKTCLKAVVAAGLDLVVIGNIREGDELRTDIRALEEEVMQRGADSIVCILSTTSCFAPRASDSVEEIAKLCERVGVGHLINNAYGVQASALCGAITRAWRRGRVDGVIQSTDKNFLVPVGGAVLAAGAKNSALVNAVNAAYPGRASLSPLLDVLITLLSLGATGWKSLLADREEVFLHLRSRLEEVAVRHGERLLLTPNNPISMAITLSNRSPSPGNDAAGAGDILEGQRLSEPIGSQEKMALSIEIGDAQSPLSPLDENAESDGKDENLTFLGSMLFLRRVSGCRIIPRGVSQMVAGIDLKGFGASHDNYPWPYMTAAGALGLKKAEVETFVRQLEKCLEEFRRTKKR